MLLWLMRFVSDHHGPAWKGRMFEFTVQMGAPNLSLTRWRRRWNWWSV